MERDAIGPAQMAKKSGLSLLGHAEVTFTLKLEEVGPEGGLAQSEVAGKAARADGGARAELAEGIENGRAERGFRGREVAQACRGVPGG